MILALIGGVDIKKYTIADILWKKLGELSNIDFEFKVIPITSYSELCAFYWSFYENNNFMGFNVALPWKSEVIKLVDFVSSDSKIYSSVNTVYKTTKGVYATNTDIIGIEESMIKSNFIDLASKSILILGGGGAGFPTSLYLTQKYGCNVYIYDISEIVSSSGEVTILRNIDDVAMREYDIIINATPVGKYYLNTTPVFYSLPISINILEKIIHSKTVVQEMNYFPIHTELMKLAISHNLRVISGVNMLVYQAVASFRCYTGYYLDNEKVLQLIDYIEKYVISKEYELLR